MTTKELILDQFDACYDTENWFVPLTEALEGLTPKQAKWNDGGSNHSIFQLVHHLIFWNERYLMRFKELPLSDINHSEHDPTFEIDLKDWGKSLDKLNEVFSELRQVITNASGKKLKSKPVKDSDEDWYSLISNINIHNAYHIGQMVVIRKLQGSWRN